MADNKQRCRDCDNVHPATKKYSTRGWRCLAVKAPPGLDLLDPDHYPDPPYARCEDIRYGPILRGNEKCPYFEPVRQLKEAV